MCVDWFSPHENVSTKCLHLMYSTVYSLSFADTHSELIYRVFFHGFLCICLSYWIFLFLCSNARSDTVTKLFEKKTAMTTIKRKLARTDESEMPRKNERNKDACVWRVSFVWCVWGVTCSWRPKVSVNYKQEEANSSTDNINLSHRKRVAIKAAAKNGLRPFKSRAICLSNRKTKLIRYENKMLFECMYWRCVVIAKVRSCLIGFFSTVNLSKQFRRDGI